MNSSSLRNISRTGYEEKRQPPGNFAFENLRGLYVSLNLGGLVVPDVLAFDSSISPCYEVQLLQQLGGGINSKPNANLRGDVSAEKRSM